MKKWLALLLVLILLPTFSLAENSLEKNEWYFWDQHKNPCRIFLSPSWSPKNNYFQVWLRSLPYTFNYNDKEITLLQVDEYQATIKHEYYPFIHLKFDVSQLTDDEIYLFYTDDFYDVYDHLYVEFKLHDTFMVRSVHMVRTKAKLWKKNAKELDIILSCKNGSRTSYEGLEISAHVAIEQPTDYTISLDEHQFSITYTFLEFEPKPFAPRDLSDMNPKTYKELKTLLAEAGLILE